MTENADLEPFVKLYQDMFGTIFKLQLVAEATTIPSRLAKLEFACESLIVKIKDAHFCASGEYRAEKELVCERCMEYAENTLRYVKAKILLSERTKDVKEVPEKKAPSQKLIAAVQYYRDEAITEHNYQEIAQKWGTTASTKLYQIYNDWCNRSDRQGDGGTDRINKNKEKLFEKIEQILENEPIALKKAKDDRLIFSKALNN